MQTTQVRSGLFLVLEGIDGSGSTTQVAQLAQAFRDQGRPVLVTREPSVGVIGRFLRQALEHRLLDQEQQPVLLNWASMALLFAADRVDHVEREIKPALEQGVVVLCDRYDLSSLVYQSVTSPEGEQALPWLRSLNQKALRPDLTLVLDLDPAEAAERRAQRGGAAELYEQQELQRRFAQLYGRAAELCPEDRVVTLSAAGSVEEVGKRVQRLVAELFPSWLSADEELL